MSYELFPQEVPERIGPTLLGIFMISWCLFHLVAIRDIRPDGFAPTMILIITVGSWTRRLFPRKSLAAGSFHHQPQEDLGAAAGFIAAIITAWGISRLTGGSVSPAFAAGRASDRRARQVDIAESMLARRGSHDLACRPATAGYSTASTPIFSWPP